MLASSQLTREEMINIIHRFVGNTLSDSDIISRANRRIEQIKKRPNLVVCYQVCNSHIAFAEFCTLAKSVGGVSDKELIELVKTTSPETIARSLPRLSELTCWYACGNDAGADKPSIEMLKQNFLATFEERWQLPFQTTYNLFEYDVNEDKFDDDLAEDAIVEAVLRAEFIAHIRHYRQSWLDKQMSPIAISQAPKPICADLE